MNEALPDVSEYEKEMEKLIKKYRDENGCYPFDIDDRIMELERLIAEGHDYHFVGRVGLFCPVVDGAGGGLLMREKDGKYYSATGAKGYRWLEAEMVKLLEKENDIDRSYYDNLVDDAVATISQYGDFEWFVSDDIEDDTPPWFGPDEDGSKIFNVR